MVLQLVLISNFMSLKYKIFSIAVFLVSLIWVITNIKLYYDYNYTAKLFMIMIPNSILIANVLIGFIALTISVFIAMRKIKPATNFIIFTALILIWSFEFFWLNM